MDAHNGLPRNGTGVGEHPLAAADLSSTLAMDLSLFMGACLLWKVLNWLELVPPTKDDHRDLRSTASFNYIIFLRHCRDMFLALTLVSAAATTWRWGVSPITAGVAGHGPLSTTAGGASDPVDLSVLCLETLLRGIIALVFVERLTRRIQKPLLDYKELDVIDRTLWLSGMPAYDRSTGEPFLFDDAGFSQVVEDLTDAINQHLERNTLGIFSSGELRVQVVPVIDQWSAASLSLRGAHERKEALTALVNVHREGLWGRWATRRYQRRLEKAAAEEIRLHQELDAIVKGPKMISGAAFVTFSRFEHRDVFLKKKPRCWEFRSHTYFSFGRPPFASMTLACTRASHPSDVNWQNLHITPMSQKVRAVILTLLLFLAMIVLTTPITISTEVGTITPVVKKHFLILAKHLDKHHIPGFTMYPWIQRLWHAVSKQLPAFFLVVVNTLILPECIYRVAMAVQPHRNSSVEVVQLHLNFVFLILNTMVIPFLGLTSIAAVVDWAQDEVAMPLSQAVLRFVHRMLHMHGIFALRYLLSSACLTNTSSMMQVPQYVYRWCARRFALTLRERLEAEEPWHFAWGYWYAWTLSVFTIGLCMSSVVPGTLPCAALFFTLQHIVDRHNLTQGIYLHGTFETENLFVIRALHYMRCIVAVWWLLMGSTFFIFAYEQRVRGEWDAQMPAWCVEGVGLCLVLLSLCLVLYSWFTAQAILHDSNFEAVDLSQSKGLGDTRFFQWAFKHVDCILNLFRKVEYSPITRETTGLERRKKRHLSEGRAMLQCAAATLLTEGPGSRSPSEHAQKREALSWQAEVAVLSSYLERKAVYNFSDPL